MLLIIAVIALTFFVNPNRFKPIIIQKVKQTTGRELVMDGDLSWSFVPWLGVKTGHIALSNPAGFSGENFFEIKSAKIGVQLFPLFLGRIEMGRIELNEAQIHLQKNVAGQENWTFAASSNKNISAATTTKKSVVIQPMKPLALMISTLDISNADVSYQDIKTQKSFNLSHFNLLASHVNFHAAFPLKMTFDLDAKQPPMSGHFIFTAKTILNPYSNIYAFQNAKLISEVKQQEKHFSLNTTGNLTVDLNKQIFSFEKFNGKLANADMVGGLEVTNLLSDPIVEGHFDLAPFDLVALLKSIGIPANNLQSAQGVRAQVVFHLDKTSTRADGAMQIDHLQAAKLQINHVSAPFHWQNDTLNVLPVSGQLYDGTLKADALVKFNQAIQVNAQLTLTHIQMQPLMNDLVGPHDVSFVGRGEVSLFVTSTGVSQITWMQHLNGKANLSLQNGYISGVDLGNLFDHAAAFVKGQPQPASGKGQTPFGSLTASALIQNGIVKNQDLLLDAPRFTINGNGTIDLVAQKIDFGLQMAAKKLDPNQKDDLSNLYGLPVPVKITGALNHPVIRLDVDRLAAAVAQKQFQKAAVQATDKLKQQIGNQLPGNAGNLLNNLLGK